MRLRRRKVEGLTTTEFVDHICDMARSIGKRFTEPTSDWSPVFFAQYEGGRTVMMSVEIPEEGEEKDVAFHIVFPQALMAMGKLQKVAFACSAWSLPTPEKWEEYKADPTMRTLQDHPEHTEVLTVTAADRDGFVTLRQAFILRDDEQPPGLSEWRVDETTIDKIGTEGRIFEMFRMVFE